MLQLNVVFTHGLFATGATGLQGHIPLDDPHFLQLPLVAAADRVPHPQAQRIKQWLAHARYDDHWKSFSVKDKYPQIRTPAYFVTGWYDNLVHENFRNFPRYARNQNTGLPLGTSAEIQTARQTIFHDAAHPSRLILPVIPTAPDDTVPSRADGSWRLTGTTARVSGPTLKLAVEAGILGAWTSVEDAACWNIEVPRASRYHVRLNFACDTAAAGNKFELVAGAGRLAGQVPATGTWYDQREQCVGEIDLQAGRQTVVLRSAGAIRGALFDLRAVTLAP